MIRILVVEDDPDLCELLVRVLTGSGYAADPALDGQTGLHRALTRRYDALVLDRRLPAIEGLDLLIRLRRHGVGTPALMLTALGDLRDRVAGLDGGAQCYLVKPFEVDELLARLRVLLRPADPPHRLRVGSAEFDLVDRRVATAGGDTTTLSGRETDLLRMFAEEPGRAFSRAQIVARVFPDAASESLVDTYVHYLRRKLGPAVIATVRGTGYRLGSL